VKHGHVVSGRRPLEQRHATLSIAEPGSTHVSPVRTALQLSNLERINADTRRPVTVWPSKPRTACSRHGWYQHALATLWMWAFMFSSESKLTPRSRTWLIGCRASETISISFHQGTVCRDLSCALHIVSRHVMVNMITQDYIHGIFGLDDVQSRSEHWIPEECPLWVHGQLMKLYHNNITLENSIHKYIIGLL